MYDFTLWRFLCGNKSNVSFSAAHKCTNKQMIATFELLYRPTVM